MRFSGKTATQNPLQPLIDAGLLSLEQEEKLSREDKKYLRSSFVQRHIIAGEISLAEFLQLDYDAKASLRIAGEISLAEFLQLGYYAKKLLQNPDIGEFLDNINHSTKDILVFSGEVCERLDRCLKEYAKAITSDVNDISDVADREYLRLGNILHNETMIHFMRKNKGALKQILSFPGKELWRLQGGMGVLLRDNHISLAEVEKMSPVQCFFLGGRELFFENDNKTLQFLTQISKTLPDVLKLSDDQIRNLSCEAVQEQMTQATNPMPWEVAINLSKDEREAIVQQYRIRQVQQEASAQAGLEEESIATLVAEERERTEKKARKAAERTSRASVWHKSTFTDTHTCLMQELLPQLTGHQEEYAPLLAALKARSYNCALREACALSNETVAHHVVTVLLRYRTPLLLNIDEANSSDGNTALHYAGYKAHQSVFDLLKTNGANDTLKNYTHLTAAECVDIFKMALVFSLAQSKRM